MNPSYEDLQREIEQLKLQLLHTAPTVSPPAAPLTSPPIIASSLSPNVDPDSTPFLHTSDLSAVLAALDHDSLGSSPYLLHPDTPHPYTPYHTLSPKAIERFSRHLLLPQVGPIVQDIWLRSSVLVIGAGGLGSPVLLYLAAAGVGRITIVDDDLVDESNLHRQVIHTESRYNTSKSHSAGIACYNINNAVQIISFQSRLDTQSAIALALRHDIVIDCTDNVPTRYLINDACVYTNTPLVSAAAVATSGQLTNFCLDNGPCYRCLNPQPPPASTVQSCSDNGVLGVLVGVVGTTQALEALKVLAHLGVQRLRNVQAQETAAASSTNDDTSGQLAIASTDENITEQHKENQQILKNNTNHDETTDLYFQTLSHGQSRPFSWPPVLEGDLHPLQGSMILWEATTTAIRTVKIRPRQETCFCRHLRPDNNLQGPLLSREELLQQDLQLVDWSCDLAPPGVGANGQNPALAAQLSSFPRITPVRLSAELIAPYIISRQTHFPTSLDNISKRDDDKLRLSTPSPSMPLFFLDVRHDNQFEIITMPQSQWCSVTTIQNNPVEFRDFLWTLFHQTFPTYHCHNPKYDIFYKQLQQDDLSAEQKGGETALQKTRRHRKANRQAPSQYVLSTSIIDTFRHAVQKNQDILDKDDIEQTTSSATSSSSTIPRQSIADLIMPSMTIRDNLTFEHAFHSFKSYVSSSQEPTMPHDNDNNSLLITNPDLPLKSFPILHISMLCRRGRFTGMLLSWIVRYILSTIPSGISDNSNTNNDNVISTCSLSFVWLAIQAGFPPFILTDVQGGIQALHVADATLPTY